MENKNFVFLGMMIPDEDYDQICINSKKSMQDAANVLQWHLYNGLCYNMNSPIHIINVLPIYSWPRFYKKMCIKKSEFNSQYSRNNINVGFLNIKGIRRSISTRNVYNALMDWCESNHGDKTVFVYTLSGDLLKMLSRVKKKHPNLQVCTIIADIPNMSNLSSKQNLLINIASKRTNFLIKKYEECVDYYVLLTRQMADYLHINKPFCVLEGIATVSNEFEKKIKKSDKERTILYSGTLHRRFGVWNLVEAFKDIKFSNYRLILCGVGDCEHEIIKATKEDERIVFLGQVSRKQALKLQKQASVVINPRQNVEDFTKYSFPSKNIEYLSSGTPLIAYKLDGIPDEYDDYIFYVNDNSKQALTNKIIEICSLSEKELEQFGKRAKKFVLSEKNEIEQTKKIISLINRRNS